MSTIASSPEIDQRDSLGDVLRRLPPLLPVYAVFVVVVVAAGLLATNVLSGVVEWDTRIVEDLASSRTDTMDELTGYGTWLADSAVSIAILIVAMVAARLGSRGWIVPVFLGAAVGSEKLIYLISSLIVGRERPPVETVGDTYASASFPSGHVGTAIALYGGIALVVGVLTGSRAIRNVLLVGAVVITAVVAYCRMYRGFHFPTDVIAGAALGTACLVASWSGIVRSERARPDTSGG